MLQLLWNINMNLNVILVPAIADDVQRLLKVKGHFSHLKPLLDQYVKKYTLYCTLNNSVVKTIKKSTNSTAAFEVKYALLDGISNDNSHILEIIA